MRREQCLSDESLIFVFVEEFLFSYAFKARMLRGVTAFACDKKAFSFPYKSSPTMEVAMVFSNTILLCVEKKNVAVWILFLIVLPRNGDMTFVRMCTLNIEGIGVRGRIMLDTHTCFCIESEQTYGGRSIGKLICSN